MRGVVVGAPLCGQKPKVGVQTASGGLDGEAGAAGEALDIAHLLRAERLKRLRELGEVVVLDDAEAAEADPLLDALEEVTPEFFHGCEHRALTPDR